MLQGHGADPAVFGQVADQAHEHGEAADGLIAVGEGGEFTPDVEILALDLDHAILTIMGLSRR
jgi:hypothetical protein